MLQFSMFRRDYVIDRYGYLPFDKPQWSYLLTATYEQNMALHENETTTLDGTFGTVVIKTGPLSNEEYGSASRTCLVDVTYTPKDTPQYHQTITLDGTVDGTYRQTGEHSFQVEAYYDSGSIKFICTDKRRVVTYVIGTPSSYKVFHYQLYTPGEPFILYDKIPNLGKGEQFLNWETPYRSVNSYHYAPGQVVTNQEELDTIVLHGFYAVHRRYTYLPLRGRDGQLLRSDKNGLILRDGD